MRETIGPTGATTAGGSAGASPPSASATSGAVRNMRSSASRFMTMMLMRRLLAARGSALSNGWLEARPWTRSTRSSARPPVTSSRRELHAGSLPDDRVLRVQGLAASLPLQPQEPLAAANRRISIIVMNREAEDRVLRSAAVEPEPQAPAEPAGTDRLPLLPR